MCTIKRCRIGFRLFTNSRLHESSLDAVYLNFILFLFFHVSALFDVIVSIDVGTGGASQAMA